MKIIKKTYENLNYVEKLLSLVSVITGCVSISAFGSLVCVPVGITSSAVGIKIAQSLQESKSISHLWSHVVIYKFIMKPYISQDAFVSINNVLGEYNNMKEEIKKSWNFS